VLAINQVRLVLRLAAAHGASIDNERIPEVLGTIGAGLGLRSLAHRLLDVVPVGGWAVQGAFAYAGTRAVGEAATAWFDTVGPVGQRATRRPAGASRGAL
jgi:uncharacterized protein (DUF697 family)